VVMALVVVNNQKITKIYLGVVSNATLEIGESQEDALGKP
jgi:hypothetical protein